MRRSLMLAGGGIKGGYQAGCLQVLLDEVGPAKLKFDHIDSASAGCFNAAMICSGKSGTQIASAWRDMNPLDLVSLNFPELVRGPWARSVGTFDGLRNKVFVDWGLDFDRIKNWKDSTVTFNCFDFSTKEVLPVPHTKLDVDYLCACVALIVWFPPIEKDGHNLVDAVFITDSNLSSAEKDTDEMWAIWSVAKLPQIRDGWIAQYFHMLEQSADGNFFAEWNRIAAAGKIKQHLIRQEVPIHYLFNLSQDRMAATVDLGIRDMRLYCRAQGLLPPVYAATAPAPPPPPIAPPPTVASQAALAPPPPSPPPPPQGPVAVTPTSVQFSETFHGMYLVRTGGRFTTQTLAFRVTVATGELGAFIRQPEHEATVTVGTLYAPELGGIRPITQGTVQILVDVRDPAVTPPGGASVPVVNPVPVIVPGNKRMFYALRFRSNTGEPYLLEGRKYVVDGPGKNVWRDTTTLYVRLYELDDADPKAKTFHGAGIVTLSPLGFLCQLASYRASGTANPLAALGAILRFFKFFIRQCWDVYARAVLDYAPF